jgi:hypothetical protein
MSGDVGTFGLTQVNAMKFPSGDSDGQFSSPGYAVRGVNFTEWDCLVEVHSSIIAPIEMMPIASVNASHFRLLRFDDRVAVSRASRSETAGTGIGA